MPGPPDEERIRRLRAVRMARLVAALAVLGLLALAQRSGIFRAFADPVRMKQTLVELGPRGYLAFILAYTCLQPFGLPGTVFVVAAPLIWPWPVAFVLSMVGTMLASVVGFSFARFIARDWLATVIPPRFQRYEAALARRAFTTVVALRFVFWMPPLLHVFFGVSRIGFWTHFWGSAVGYLVPLFLVSFFGQRLVDALERLIDALSASPARGVGMVLGAALLAVAIGLAARRWRARRGGG